jgi:hypothetical protein
VVRHLAVEAKPTEPAVSEVQVNFLAQPPFGTNAVAVANQQHPDEQLGINRRPASRAIKWCQVASNVLQIDKVVDRPQQVGGRNMSLKGELVEQRRLINLPRTHHRFRSPAPQDGMNQRTPSASTGEFFNTIGQKRTWPRLCTMSALAGASRADIVWTPRHVRFVPLPDSCIAANCDQLCGASVPTALRQCLLFVVDEERRAKAGFVSLRCIAAKRSS